MSVALWIWRLKMMTPEFQKKWIERCITLIDSEYYFSVSLEPRKDQNIFTDEFWRDISFMKSLISDNGSYDGFCHGEGYCCTGIFDSFDKMLEVANKLSSAFPDRLGWKVYRR